MVTELVILPVFCAFSGDEQSSVASREDKNKERLVKTSLMYSQVLETGGVEPHAGPYEETPVLVRRLKGQE